MIPITVTNNFYVSAVCLAIGLAYTPKVLAAIFQARDLSTFQVLVWSATWSTFIMLRLV